MPSASPWTGRRLRRPEDELLLRGRATYTSDLSMPGMLHAVMLRSPHAHARVLSVDTVAARAMPGVRGVFTAADLEVGGFGPLSTGAKLTGSDGAPMQCSPRPILAQDRVRHVGESVAFVVATSVAEAGDALEAIVVDWEALPAVASADDALLPGAPAVQQDSSGNVALHFHFGDAGSVARAFAGAAHVTRVELVSNRIVVNPMETRAALGLHDGETGDWTLWVGSQGPNRVRDPLAQEVLRVPKDRLRVRTGQVGGGFGTKLRAYAEYACVLFAARALGAPVRWVDTRTESFASDNHGRDHRMVAELALDGSGCFLAVRLTGHSNAGAYPAPPGQITTNAVKNIASVYGTPLIEVSAKVVLTHTATTAAYRGARRPEANYYMERLIEVAAQELGLDPLELRRRNHVRRMPHAAPSGMTYDSGDFTSVLDAALHHADWAGFAGRRAASRARGRLRGRGLGQFLEATGEVVQETGEVCFTEDRQILLRTGTMDSGQGHWISFAQVVADRLGVPPELICLEQGDTDAVPVGGGSFGSRSMAASGVMLSEACTLVIAAARKAAGWHFSAPAEAVAFDDGVLSIPGTNASIRLLDLAQRLHRGAIAVPEGEPATLDCRVTAQAPPANFPNGCHIAEVEIDPETGEVTLARYTAVDDIGLVVNPMLAEGQMQGGIAQGIGQALTEHTVHDPETGQLLTASFMDYALPRAGDLPALPSRFLSQAATTNLLGVKGCGEAGVAGALPAVMNAVLHALAERGVHHLDMPATPFRIWSAIEAASKAT